MIGSNNRKKSSPSSLCSSGRDFIVCIFHFFFVFVYTYSNELLHLTQKEGSRVFIWFVLWRLFLRCNVNELELVRLGRMQTDKVFIIEFESDWILSANSIYDLIQSYANANANLQFSFILEQITLLAERHFFVPKKKHCIVTIFSNISREKITK